MPFYEVPNCGMMFFPYKQKVQNLAEPWSFKAESKSRNLRSDRLLQRFNSILFALCLAMYHDIKSIPR